MRQLEHAPACGLRLSARYALRATLVSTLRLRLRLSATLRPSASLSAFWLWPRSAAYEESLLSAVGLYAPGGAPRRLADKALKAKPKAPC
ncbi:hypothetical protein AVDCRST_MAG82-1653 [uncultured Rubrobacteraceae bacterium]|uniref:Uncharacterized protein n=1 Tax=uncultured Rubrobacteraceae bacterium TaxID=349277 RepID=A0A6J4PTL8_9ACTN|nr:hypothetical protein AVDCRST_MAG82-1653 [uncultured Rubrobacteraceae bacterium]